MTKMLQRLLFNRTQFNRTQRGVWLGVLASLTALLTVLTTPGLATSSLATFSLATSSLVQNSAQTDFPACLRETIDAAATFSLPSVTSSPETFDILQQSWIAYRDRFIQDDGRVIDREANDRTVSEGQAYAMLRAVLINDPETFVQTLTWAENNLVRKNEQGDSTDSLWAWKWGRTSRGEWTTIDANFASDADLDAAVALILAARRWNCPEYEDLARQKLEDLWELSTVNVKGDRYFMPGPKAVFWDQPDALILNPSYLAPYAFRLFAQVDSERDWMELVDSSYDILQQSADLSEVGLPSDWIAINPDTGDVRPVPSNESLRSQYGFDAYRVWWRVAWDLAWFNERRAERYLDRHLDYLEDLWQTQQNIPAQIGLDGEALVDYEATSQYAMLYFAFQLIEPEIAAEIYQQKLVPQYNNGFWDSDSAYYTQNLAWFALVPATAPEELLQADSRCANLFNLHTFNHFLRSVIASRLLSS